MIRSSALGSSPGKVGLILGSTRPGGNGRTVAKWIQQLIRNAEQLCCEYYYVDLAAWDLPLFDEPNVPAKSPPVHEHTKAWQQQVAALDGFLFVSPQVKPVHRKSLYIAMMLHVNLMSQAVVSLLHPSLLPSSRACT